MEPNGYEPVKFNFTTKSPWNGLPIAAVKEYCGNDPNLDFLDAVVVYNNDTAQMNIVIQEGDRIIEITSSPQYEDVQMTHIKDMEKTLLGKHGGCTFDE